MSLNGKRIDELLAAEVEARRRHVPTYHPGKRTVDDEINEKFVEKKRRGRADE